MLSSKKSTLNMKKIALFIPNLEIGGAERVITTLAKNFTDKGFCVDLVVACKCGALLNELGEGINLIDLKSLGTGHPKWLSALKTVVSLAIYLKNNSPDVIMSTLTGANIITILARMLSNENVRLVVREAASLANMKSRFRLRLMRFLYHRADEVIVLTEFMKDELVNTVGLSDSVISVIGNPIDCRRVLELSDEPSGDYHAVELRPYAIVVGRLAEQKGCFDAIDAFAQIIENQDLNLIFVGDGPQENSLKQYVKQLGITDRVFFLGELNNPFPLLKNAKVHILPSRWEGYPNILLESMCLGKAIVVTEYDKSLRSILADYPNSLVRIVTPGNISSIAESILILVKQSCSVETVKDKNNIEEIAEKYLYVLGAI